MSGPSPSLQAAHLPAGNVEVLVVDDSPLDRALVAGLLRAQLKAQVRLAADGTAALAEIARTPPDLVLTDLQMPELDGLALVEAIRREFPRVPAVLMTAHGSEEIALAALRAGAASYVNKRHLAQRIAETVLDVLTASLGQRQSRRLHECWGTTEFAFELENDPTLIPVLVQHVQEYAGSIRGRDDGEQVRIGVALHEALRNAMHHGNLELTSTLRQQDPESYYRLAEQRQKEQPFAERRVRFRAQESRFESRYVIADEGPGFDVGSFHYDPTDASNLDRPAGRGLFLIRTFMERVEFNARGNEITMVHGRTWSVDGLNPNLRGPAVGRQASSDLPLTKELA